ncbi:MAG: M48 family metallopeptidase [Verrucomicrobia bacterium]|nr:M48 family metallopeptidase [Verrucomicrobiota bacterium]
MELNVYFFTILIALVAIYKMDLFAAFLNLRSLAEPLPPEFQDVFTGEDYEKSQEYTRAKTVFGIVESTFSSGLFLVFWFAGGFGWLDQWVRSLASNEVGRGVLLISAIGLGGILSSLPFEIYRTFVLEERFGFNRTSVKTFLSDQIKSLLLSATLGLPVFALIVWLFVRWELAWLHAFLLVTAGSLILAYVAPKWLLPIFYKFTPMEDGELKKAIDDLAARCGFPLAGIHVMDGSKRSTKANAFFTGFGNTKRIALFDTLIQHHSVPELVAVLAHEIGHYKRGHILQSMLAGIAESALSFFLLGFFLRNEGLFHAFGVRETSVFMSLILFGILFTPLNRVSSILRGIWSRKNEFEADAYAASVTGHPGDLVTALKKLTRENLGNLTPHPFHVFLNDSHPPVHRRITALRAG